MNATFSQLTQSEHLDWAGAGYTSRLQVYYIIPEDAMAWMQSPYTYVFLDDGTSGQVVNSAEVPVVNSAEELVMSTSVSCIMNAIWDWTEEDSGSVKISRDIQLYNHRDGHTLSVSKNKIRGRGKVLQLQFTSDDRKDFNLLGWAVWISKNAVG